MTRENGLWRWLSGASRELGGTLHMNRVENPIMKGMPDVEGHLTGAEYGQFWMELKSAGRPARPETPVRFKVRDREEQVAWLVKRRRVGGLSWLLLQVGSGQRDRRLYLVPGGDAAEVYLGVTEVRLAELDVLRDPKVRAVDVVRHAAQLR